MKPGLLDPLSQTRALMIEAHPARLHQARDWAHRVAVAAGLDEARCYEVKLAMSEAVSNAIEHGSQGCDDSIAIEAFHDGDALVFEVRDTGTGTGLAPPAGRTSVEDESGRGLELLTVIMDEVEMTSAADGSVLRFAKRFG